MTTTTTNDHLLRVLTLTLVRHGESTDNIIPIWAGHRDATLTNFGHSQAQRLGDSLKDEDFDRIFCSDLKRAHLTANQIRIQNLKNPVITPSSDQNSKDEESNDQGTAKKKSDLVVLPLIREQNFGEAEGERWDTGRCTYEGFYSNKALKFKDGESRDDVYERAAKFHKEVIIPEWSSILSNDQPTKHKAVHFCIVSHGIFLSELIAYLKAFVEPSGGSSNPEHFSNTGWERINLTWNWTADHHQPLELVSLKKLHSNVTQHLTGLKRQPGGIGNAPWDPNQSKLDAFFSVSPKK
ncbi:hypothetical protein PGTUg99_029476 [Puccinia graminis f. sp. tritici]|uniref:Phosphoglycerate mutase-like protein n=1 Tax=Puccinia graminis f. sp. tritici TaxID=56615 RepID=A0A5B0SF48_PUCGR|nr:hypothetical protein PGTUg99_029476 [Puccinia graminis f. sp. tritici]